MTSAEFRDKNPDYAHANDRTVVIKELAGGVRLFVDLADHVIGLGIIRGHYEEDAVRLVQDLLKAGDTAMGGFTMARAFNQPNAASAWA